jgi:hypothetical protein
MIVVLYQWICCDNVYNFSLYSLLYSSFEFYLPEDGHMVGRNM